MNKFILFLLLFFNCTFCFAESVNDEIAEALPKGVKQPLINTSYNYESTEKVPIKLKIIKNIKSESELYEGQYLDFKVTKDVLYNNKVVAKRGEIIPARVSVIITPGMNGIPASIILKDFDIERVAKNKITNCYEITGQDRSLLVFPLKWALTIIPPAGSLTNLIMGGHAKLKTKKPITVYYYPEW
jgi:hypothetical protein